MRGYGPEVFYPAEPEADTPPRFLFASRLAPSQTPEVAAQAFAGSEIPRRLAA